MPNSLSLPVSHTSTINQPLWLMLVCITTSSCVRYHVDELSRHDTCVGPCNRQTTEPTTWHRSSVGEISIHQVSRALHRHQIVHILTFVATVYGNLSAVPFATGHLRYAIPPPSEPKICDHVIWSTAPKSSKTTWSRLMLNSDGIT